MVGEGEELARFWARMWEEASDIQRLAKEIVSAAPDEGDIIQDRLCFERECQQTLWVPNIGIAVKQQQLSIDSADAAAKDSGDSICWVKMRGHV